MPDISPAAGNPPVRVDFFMYLCYNYKINVRRARFVHLVMGEDMPPSRSAGVKHYATSPEEALPCIKALATSRDAAAEYLARIIRFEPHEGRYSILLANGKIIVHTIDLRSRDDNEVEQLHQLVAAEVHLLAKKQMALIGSIYGLRDLDHMPSSQLHELLRRLGVEHAGPWVKQLNPTEIHRIHARIEPLERRYGSRLK